MRARRTSWPTPSAGALAFLVASLAASAPPPPGRAPAPSSFELRLVGDGEAWRFTAPGPDGRFDTPDDVRGEGELPLPAGVKVRLLLESRGAIYVFALPGLGVSALARPDRVERLELGPLPEGLVEVSGADLCGAPHGWLKTQLRVVPRAQLDATLERLRRDAGAPGHLPLPDAAAPGGAALRPPPLPDFWLRDSTGASLSNDTLRGSVWVADFFFTSCPGICPRLSQQMATLAKTLTERRLDRAVRLVSLSVDPDHDTPEVLARHRAERKYDAPSWTFATGTRDSVRALVDRGFRLPVRDGDDPSTPIIHTSLFAVVDRDLRVRGYHDVFTEAGRAALVAQLEALVAEPAPQWLYVPPDVAASPWLSARLPSQRAALADAGVDADLHFDDRVAESGITFVNHAVEDAAKRFIAVHYDHGDAVAAADVDGDGRVDLYFVSQLGRKELWRNLGGGRFTDVTELAGVGLDDRIGVAAAFADVDDDGDPDLFVTTVRGGNVLFENDGHGHFTDVTERAGLGYVGHSAGAVFFDFDRDGRLDLFVANIGRFTTDERTSEGAFRGRADAFAGHQDKSLGEANRLYRNLGGGAFADVTREQGLLEAHWSGDATPLDANGDGWPDLYVLSMQGHDEYYENDHGRRFVKKSRALFPRTPWGSMGAKVFDADSDGRVDLLVVDMHTDMISAEADPRRPETETARSRVVVPESFLETDGRHVAGNALFRAQADGGFTEVGARLGVESYWPWGVSVGDLNADGFADVFVTAGMGYPFRYGVDSVLLNAGGRRLLDAAFPLGVEPRRGGRVARPWFDLECSGADRAHERCRGKKGPATVFGARSTRSSVLFDLDGDGDLDVVTNEWLEGPRVLVSDLAQRRTVHFLKVALVGRASNRDGLGALVTVTAGGRAQVQAHDGRSGYLAQSTLPLYFGLGAASTVDQVEVRWPSGRVQTRSGPIPSGTTLRLVEP